MSEVTVRELRNNGGAVIDRVAGGETATVTRAGKRVAVANDLPLYTCHAEDFAGVDGLDVIAVPHPDNMPEQRK